MTELPIDSDPSADIRAAPPPQRAIRRGPRSASTREAMREPSRDGVVYGRDGQVLSRSRSTVGDIFEIPPELKEPGWDYQWNAVTVHGNGEILLDQNHMMYSNGWRPVPADRKGFAGRFTPIGAKGDIVRGGQRLEERPKTLGDQARAEELAKAVGQMRDRDEALMGGKAKLRNSMNDGMSMERRYRGTGGDVRMSIDPGIDIPRPQHQLATGDE